MQARTRTGLIVGVIGLVLNICVAGFIGFCGPGLSLIAGAIAGFLAAQQEKPATKNEGARAGAIAGGIAGTLIILGQIIGGIGALFYMQSSGTSTPFGQVPSLSGDPSTQVIYYATGAGTALCFGIIGALLAAGAGAGTGYLSTSERPVMPPSANIMS
ncbi:MAG TPA: hypothetical protein VK206_14640 [Anaerolineales bacterium]|nr:hypothetical protein [Anaerolineales bacterium]